MKQIQTQIIILKRMNFSEADRIITAITPDMGKISLLAKGARKQKSKLAGGLELLSVSEVSYIDGRSDLKTVTSTRLKTHYRHITKNIETSMMAYEMIKLIDKATQETCDSIYFELLTNAMACLNESAIDLDLQYCWFAIRLLEHSGHGINAEVQVNGEPLSANSQFVFDYDNMGFTDHHSGQYGPKHVKFIRLLAGMDKPNALQRIIDGDAVAGDVKQLLAQSVKIIF
ncbi:MAG: DNA repair protein RecO (recombination protein O) [Candidatus Saccharimonadales bacterium]|jgi:DNA repair protein RecO (recombination protein O)